MIGYKFNCKFRLSEPLKNHSTIGIGGNAKYYFEPTDFKQCLEVFNFINKYRLPYYILGNGSNTLCSSDGFDGVVLNTLKFNNMYNYIIRFKKFRHCNLIYYKLYVKKSIVRNNVHNINKIHYNLFDMAQNYIIKNNINKIFIKKKVLYTRCYCGMNLIKLSHYICNKGYTGLEFACSIPASVGGATKMNAGAFGGQMSDNIYRVLIFNIAKKQVYYKYNTYLPHNLYKLCDKFCRNKNSSKKYTFKVLTLKSIQSTKNSKYFNNIVMTQEKQIKLHSKINKKHTKTKNYNKFINCAKFKITNKNLKKTIYIRVRRGIIKNINFCNEREYLITNYRYSNIMDEEFIIAVDFVFINDNKDKISKTVNFNKAKRIATQSVGYGSLGSVFKRQGDIIPARLIEESGLKGLRLGGVMVSKVHSGFIVNCGFGTSAQFYKLLKIIRNIICKKYNIMLQYELKFLGEIDEEKRKG